MLEKLKEILMKIPVANLLPALIVLLSDMPKRFEALPEEKKQELFESLVAAGTKAAASYAKK